MTDTSEYQPIISPCIGVCQLGDNKLCAGCFRKPEEITYWRTYSDEERNRIRDELVIRSKEARENNF